ncbi:MAG: tRNA (guanosine(37)-N1)-methyltransferase TrmD [Acidobacteria bacterium]|nr:tRNA (guanosine(37)-N1)-methyltransferase TrmD [Acidobacteriota bacterium]
MHIAIITIFPDFFAETLEISIVGKARATGLLETTVVDLREFGSGVHRQVDDAPFGGGVGMVLQPEPMANALGPYAATRRILLTPAGATLTQVTLDRWALLPALTLVCGRYEGVDERIAENFIDEEVSIGDYVLLGGEVAALAIVEGVTRLLPGALGNPESVHTESFRNGLLEEPQYTRPADWRGWSVPDVLLSGHHERVEEWRRQQRLERTRLRRPDLLRTEFAEPREVE